MASTWRLHPHTSAEKRSHRWWKWQGRNARKSSRFKGGKERKQLPLLQSWRHTGSHGLGERETRVVLRQTSKVFRHPALKNLQRPIQLFHPRLHLCLRVRTDQVARDDLKANLQSWSLQLPNQAAEKCSAINHSMDLCGVGGIIQANKSNGEKKVDRLKQKLTTIYYSSFLPDLILT